MDEDVSAAAILSRRRGVCCGHHLVSAPLRACGIPTLGVVHYTLCRGSKGWWYDGNNMDYRNGRVFPRSCGLGRPGRYCDA